MLHLSLQYLKLEEVSEQTRLNQWQIEHRNSLLAVMFHHTINHEQESSWNGDTLEPEGDGEGREDGSGKEEELMDTVDMSKDYHIT